MGNILRCCLGNRLYEFYLHAQIQMPHLRNVIATEIDREMFQSLQNAGNESAYFSTNQKSEGSRPKDSSNPSNSPTAITAGKQDLQSEPTAKFQQTTARITTKRKWNHTCGSFQQRDFWELQPMHTKQP